jgi:hypothetical protein
LPPAFACTLLSGVLECVTIGVLRERGWRPWSAINRKIFHE